MMITLSSEKRTSTPKYSAITIPMNTHRYMMKRPCVIRYVLHVS